MIKQLQKIKAKRGFTMVELIMVIAIIAILAAMILPSLDTKKAAIDDACSASRDMYNAAQSIFTKYSLTEAPLNLGLKTEGNEAEKDSTKSYSECVRFYKKAGGNFPCKTGTITVSDMPETTELFIEVVAEKGIITEVNVASSDDTGHADVYYTPKAMKTLLMRGTDTQDTLFGAIFKNDLETRMDVHEGFYYIYVNYTAPPKDGVNPAAYTNPVKVNYAAYSKARLPQLSGEGAWNQYRLDYLDFSKGNYINKQGQVIGVFGAQVTRSGNKLERGTMKTSLGHGTFDI
ncbi:MAG: prepilin-type N-terminal cleavage/methylation domain-containing protein [Ruminococcaceae bacterium]|nr:prepilin-type N-terminal cleavage/methylation domain-containing protein [Oscillospiraceae bacterium]